MKSTLDVLIDARALIEKPENWCRGMTSCSDGETISYCAMGALSNAAGVDFGRHLEALGKLQAESLQTFVVSGDSELHVVAQFNDASKHSDVLALFDRAIAAERKKLGLVDDKIAVQVQAILDHAVKSAQVSESVG